MVLSDGVIRETLPAVFEMRNVWKSFGGIAALSDAELVLARGEIHALLGENGAGKSTLINIATGVFPPDSGTLLLAGGEVRFPGPGSAAQHGIAVVHQERNLVSKFSVGENIFLGDVPRKHGLVAHREMLAGARPWLELVGLDVNPATKAGELSPGQAQLLEIAKALARRCHVLLLDEPTSSITETDAEHLFGVLRSLRDRGTSIVFVSHKLEEIYALCDRVTVLRDGRNVISQKPLADVGKEELVQAMVGRHVESAPRGAGGGRNFGAVRLELVKIRTEYGHRDVDLSVRAGEVVGMYGLVGAGRTELARCIVGLAKIAEGDLRVDGRSVKVRNPYDALRNRGIGYVSEDRKGEGLILPHSVGRNIGITVWDRLSSPLGWISDSRGQSGAESLVERLRVRMSSLSQPAGSLSGGNQQKVSVAKWLAAETRVLIIDEPTVGVDVAAKEAIHDLIRNLARDGMAVLLISSDLREVIQLADRIVVMGGFRVLAEYDNSGEYGEMSQTIMESVTQAATLAGRA